MKIARIETHVCHARMRNWVFVKVVHHQDGLFGWGEATLEWHTRSVVGAVDDVAQLLIGQDPTRVEHLWQMMFRQHFWHGSGIVRAVSVRRCGWKCARCSVSLASSHARHSSCRWREVDSLLFGTAARAAPSSRSKSSARVGANVTKIPRRMGA